MFKGINRNNRLFMLSNFLFAASFGLWMNLRQLHLLDLRATPAEIGTVFALLAVAGGLLPLPAGLLTDRIGPKRVILLAWLLAVIGAGIAAAATTWPVAAAGMIIFMLCIAANPATVSFVLLNAADEAKEGQAARVMATVFASWPAAMIFAPVLGGALADALGISSVLWIGTIGLLSATGVFLLAVDVRPVRIATQRAPLNLMHNRPFLHLAVFYPAVLTAIYIGYALAPTYLEQARGYSAGGIGALFSILSGGTLIFNYIVGKTPARRSFVILIGSTCVGILVLWQFSSPALTAGAFVLLGGVSTTWLLAQTSFGQLVDPAQRGVALGITESLGYGGVALASWLAGQLYGRTETHELPLVVGLAAMLVMLALWFVLPLARQEGAHPKESVVESGEAVPESAR